MHDEAKKIEADMAELCTIEKDLLSALKTVVSHGVFSKDVDHTELGELVDMVKDMAETKRNCWEAHYYKTVTEAMEKGEMEEEMDLGRKRSHRPKCIPTHMMRKHLAGYTPYDPDMDYETDDWDPVTYPKRMNGNGMNGRDWDDDRYDQKRSNGRNEKYNNQYGEAFGEYEDARRHYTETKSLEDKNHMDEKAMEHVDHSMMTLRDIWKNADPTVRKEVASAIATLASEFKTV